MISLITPSIAGSYASSHGSSPSPAFSHFRTGTNSRRPGPRRLPEEASRPSQKQVEAPEIGRYPDADWVEAAKPGSQQRPEPGQVGSAPGRHRGETTQAGSEESADGTGAPCWMFRWICAHRQSSSSAKATPRVCGGCPAQTSGAQQRVYSPPNAYSQAITPQLA